MKKLKMVLFFSALTITGCSSTYVGKVSDPSRKVVNVDGYEINVISHVDSDSYEAFGGESFGYDALKLKRAQVSAIENVSGCKVVGSEYSNTFVRTLHAQVKC